jgi:hypothetical protein
MFNLTICFGPTGTVWAFLFKDKERADAARKNATQDNMIEDDFGQVFHIVGVVHGILLEDLDQIEQARIQRALADERVKAKFMVAAKSDPVIRQAIQGQQAPIMTPFRGG